MNKADIMRKENRQENKNLFEIISSRKIRFEKNENRY